MFSHFAVLLPHSLTSVTPEVKKTWVEFKSNVTLYRIMDFLGFKHSLDTVSTQFSKLHNKDKVILRHFDETKSKFIFIVKLSVSKKIVFYCKQIKTGLEFFIKDRLVLFFLRINWN